MKELLKSFCPPILVNFIKKNRKYGWKGEYKSWAETKKKTTGYEQKEILDKVKTSLLKVKNGEAVFERDSVIFDKIQYSWPLLSGLLFVAAKNNGVLNVIDFGGSLGSTYFQNRKFLCRLKDFSWNVVEQKHFVDVGKEEFEDNNLSFFYDVKTSESVIKSQVILFSSVLQYIESPYDFLDDVLSNNFKYILIDRTPFSKGKEKITLQKVPDRIYKASYPCWFFDKEKFLNYFCKKCYEVIE